MRSAVDLTADDGGDITEPDCYSTVIDDSEPGEQDGDQDSCAVEPAESVGGDRDPNAPIDRDPEAPSDPVLSVLVATFDAPTPTPSPESFDSELTENEDPCKPDSAVDDDHTILVPPPWRPDRDMIKRIDDLIGLGLRDGFLTRGCMDDTIGLDFEAAADEAMEYISNVVPSFGAWKVGITCDPCHRWSRTDKNVGHRKNFDGMDLVYVHEHPKPHRHGSAGHMEIELIKRCRTMSSAILNKLPGGEGAPRASPCFVYIAWRVNE